MRRFVLAHLLVRRLGDSSVDGKAVRNIKGATLLQMMYPRNYIFQEAWNLSSQVSERGSALLLGRNSSPLSRPARAKMDDKDAENLVTRNKKGKANVQKYAGILSRIQTKEKLRDPGKPKMGPNIKPLAHPVLSKRGHAMLHGSTECRKSQLYTLS
ncbi:hypothetical protein D8B26_001219 [Coccidioides posadasii str. Silveira]|uniref:uncharacterized protein n=1 Tax=Coccidioides posadasii (strain RMSCC 757 / Silveira) TaxID=443226 RepID=UPI001BF02554|nr:hypothetical protein D8B26_001219 [Coccidioides posadasii str. Silveira]